MKNKYTTEELYEASQSFKSNKTIISLLFIIAFLIALFSGAYYIKYPKTVEGKIIITSLTNTYNVYSPLNGKVNILKKERDELNAGETIAYIENPTNYQDLISLEKDIKKFNLEDLNQSIDALAVNLNYKLGSIQEFYYNFIISVNTYKNITKNNIYKTNIQKYSFKIKENQKQIELLGKVKRLQDNKVASIKANYTRDSILEAEGVISKNDLNISRTNYLNQMENMSSSDVRIHDVSSSNKDIKGEINSLNAQNNNETSKAIIDIEKQYFNLINAIETWKNNYLIISPIDGQLQFVSPFISKSSYISRETKLFIILPHNNNLIGKAFLTPKNYGPLKVGQSAIIKLSDYPYRDYGIIKGTLSKKSPIASDTLYQVDVKLNNGLVTNTHKKLEYYHNMTGVVEFTTKKMSLLERFMNILSSINEE
ncbi:hypothetical protein HZQ57_15960 [Elizabethkingia anophelis]|nr:hypothetical protein [Elizabethkingia anophelis]MCT3813896.1 hypothetical protein [Elizabethkingia anophelis]MCT3820990.1 hypothetical protein [Elizabethkingia anophelis]